MKKSTTKRALFMSFVSMFLCFTMLLGTTYAWFTDSVTSGVNTIVAGNLDVELYHTNETDTDETVTEAVKLFDKVEKWEPGAMVWEKFTIVNEGNLALKYQFSLNAFDATEITVGNETYSFADMLKVAVVGEDFIYNRDNILALDESEWSSLEAFALPTTKLEAKADNATENPSDVYGIIIWWQPSNNDNIFNINNGDVVSVNVGVNLFATQVEAEFDSFGDDYDADAITLVGNADEAQAALDNADAGAIIQLAPGIDYGTLYLRPVDGQDNTITNCDYLVYRNEMLRKVENLTIVGAPGATIDAIKVVAGYIEGSTGYVVDIKNLVIDSVEFNDTYTNAPHSFAAPIFFDLTYTNVDGVTVKNCELVGNNAKMNFVYVYGSGNPSNSTFETAAKNITITGNTVDGIARLCELRQTENVTITNNIIKNTALHGILLPVDGGTYTGNVTITGNTADCINERFVRMAGAGDAVVVIKDNVINNYMGADDDYIKVTDGNNVTIENNPMTRAYKVSNTAEAQAALDNITSGATIMLAPNVNYGTLYLRPTTNNPATKSVDWIGNNYGYESYSLFENLTIVGAEGATVDAIEIEGGTYYHTEHSQAATYPVMLSLVELKNVVIDGVTFTGNGGYDPQGYGNVINLSGSNIKVDGLTLKNCVLENSANNARLIYKTESTTHVHNYAYDGQTYTFVPTLKDITVTGCTFNGGYMGLELRETENVTITNNVFNVADRNILLPVNSGYTYSGTVTITGNVSNNAQERFVRMAGAGDAVVVIKDNTINNYVGADVDYIKVTDGTNVTIENNIKN